MERQRVDIDDVNISLQELSVSALLRAFTPPRLLNLVSLEREVQVPSVLKYVARERNREIEMKAES